MNKAELINKIYETTDSNIKKSHVTEIINKFCEIVIQTVQNKEDINLVGFGKFGVSERKAKRGVNPQTKEYITIPSKTKPVFSFSKTIKCNE